MKKWDILNQFKVQNSKFKIDELIRVLLENRNINTKKEREEFLNPKLEELTVKSVGIDKKQLTKAVKRIQEAIENKEKIVVFGDYDVDGICGTAILWETLFKIGADVMPYIPHRIDEGYGLSILGIENVILNLFQDPKKPKEMLKQGSPDPIGVQHDKRGLIITVDNGIVAHEAVDYANSKGIDVIITDHHVVGEKLPDAFAIVHTTKLCGAGVAWTLSDSIASLQNDKEQNDHLALVALATVADLVPLIGANRTILKYGLDVLHTTNRIGLLALFKEAGIDQKSIDTYQIGYMLAPRLNAMGRMEYAMDSLRLLCTKNKTRAQVLADTLGRTNKERQLLTQETVTHAISGIRDQGLGNRKLLFVSHQTYQPGVIGLVAGKLVEEFYRPAIVLSIGEVHSKASARSVSGFNIIEFIRSASGFLVNAGGHPMAAGFTVETAKIPILQNHFLELAEQLLDDDKLIRSLRIDCELPFSYINIFLYNEIQKLAPFGVGNPEPTFMTRKVAVAEIRIIGKENKHLKLRFQQYSSSEHKQVEKEILNQVQDDSSRQARTIKTFNAVAFGFGQRAQEFNTGDKVDIVYVIDENEWNEKRSMQLKVKDIKSFSV